MKADSPFVVHGAPGMLWSDRRPRLTRLDIELTERCNNACIHCYINQPSADAARRRRELDCAAVCEVLRQAANLGALSVRLTGGEPLLREDFADIYLEARRLGLAVSVFTNARLVTDRVAALFERVPPLLPVTVTVYGARQRSYEKVTRAHGSYEEMVRGIERLVRHRVPFTIDGVWLPQTRDEIAVFEAWVESMGSEALPTWVVYLHRRARRDSPRRSAAIAALRPSPGEVGLFLDAKRAERLNGGDHVPTDLMGPRGRQLFLCGAGHSLCLDAYGALQPCMQLRHPDVVYDLRNGTLQEAVVEFFPSVRRLVVSNSDYLERCSNCFLGVLCEQCAGWSWTEHGTLDTPVDYLCDCAHARARDLGLLEEGEHSWEIADWKARVGRE